MRIGQDVDIPEDLLAAQREGTLVLFVGAGVSMGPPSCLPSFKDLTELVGSATAERRPHERMDEYLGRVEEGFGTNVQQLARDVLSNPNSKPRQLHSDLVALFRGAEFVRIITTNFDNHLTTACQTLFGDVVEIYVAPALPTGREFAGLAYLHGSLGKPKSKLVLTDSDFGRAYITEGWATRLLVDVFHTFTVLFIGYSHDDPVMRYLSRSLSGTAPRFVLTLLGEDDKWKMLGIKPIHFPKRDTGYAFGALDDAISAWVKRSRMGALDHRNRIRDLVAGPPTLAVEDHDYLRLILTDSMMTRFFTEEARSVEWLNWADSIGALDSLFQDGDTTSNATDAWSQWLAEHYSVTHAAATLRLIGEKGGRLSRQLWYTLGWYLASAEAPPSADILGKWVAILISTARPDYPTPFLEQLLKRCDDDTHAVPAKLLFRYLIQPYPVIERPWTLSSEPEDTPRVRFTLRCRGDTDDLREFWQNFLTPRLLTWADFLYTTLSDALVEAYTLDAAQFESGFDSISYGKQAIEQPDDATSSASLNFITDCLRDLLEANIAASTPRASEWLVRWLDSDFALLRRLALHGLAESPGSSPDSRLDLLTAKGLLYAPYLKHEVFRVVEKSFSHASPAAQQRLIEYANSAEVLPGSDDDAERQGISDYERYNFAAWLITVAPDSTVAKANFEHWQAAHPKFQKRDVMDYDSWGGGVYSVVEKSPRSPEELLAHAPEESLGLLLTFERAEGDFDGPSPQGLMQAVREASARRPAWSFELGQKLADQQLWDARVWPPLLSGWRDAEISSGTLHQIAAALEQWPELFGRYQREVADFVEAVASKPEALSSDVLPHFERVASAVCLAEGPGSGLSLSDGRREWLTVAINQSGGRSALALVKLLSARIKVMGELPELPEPYRHALERLLAAQNESAANARTIIASQLHFFLAVDERWTLAYVLPLFDWQRDESVAERAWHGFTHWGRWNDSILASLTPFFRDTFRRLGGVLSELSEALSDRLVGVSLYLATDPWHGGWLSQFIQEAGEGARARWTSAMANELRRMKPEAVRTSWDSWMRDYWDARLRGVPRALTSYERGEMVNWALGMREIFAEAVSRIVAHPTVLPQHHFFFHRLRDDALVTTAPEEVAKLIAHLLESGSSTAHQCGYLEDIVTKMHRTGADRALLDRIVDLMVRSGCSTRADLLGT